MSLFISVSSGLNFSLIFSDAGFAYDFTKCPSWSWLWKRQEIFKGLWCLLNTLKHLLLIWFSSKLFLFSLQAFKELVATCLVKDPKKRPSSEKLLKHHFFKQARASKYLARTILEGLAPLGDRFRLLKVCCSFANSFVLCKNCLGFDIVPLACVPG